MKSKKALDGKIGTTLTLNETQGAVLYFYHILIFALCRENYKFAQVSKGMRGAHFFENARKKVGELLVLCFEVYPDWPNQDTRMLLEICQNANNGIDHCWRLKRCKITIPAITPAEGESFEVSMSFSGSFPEGYRATFEGSEASINLMKKALWKTPG